VYRVVFDPGVLIAALISPIGAPAHLVQAWLDGQFDLIVSPQLLAELERVLLRPKFRRYVTIQQVDEYVWQFQ
jgi:putative PIN family toxin of toxin-antitoxin system